MVPNKRAAESTDQNSTAVSLSISLAVLVGLVTMTLPLISQIISKLARPETNLESEPTELSQCIPLQDPMIEIQVSISTPGWLHIF